MANKVVWVSGASSGLGKALAQALWQNGWQVVAGARSFQEEQQQERFAQFRLDVRDQASVDAFAKAAASRFGAPEALVNAAGILVMGPVEETSLEEFHGVMDTVLYGSLRLTRAALPLMREQGHGKIVMLSSVNGLMPTPFQGAYVAAKHALEGLSECLMLETHGQGIQVMLVEPGDHAGGSDTYRPQAKQVSPLYADSLKRVRATIFKDEAQGASAQSFGRKLARVLDKKRLPARFKVATLKEKAAVVLHDVLPGRLFQKFLSDYYKV